MGVEPLKSVQIHLSIVFCVTGCLGCGRGEGVAEVVLSLGGPVALLWQCGAAVPAPERPPVTGDWPPAGGCSNSQLQQVEHIHRSGRICANRGAFIFLSSAVVVEWFSVDNGK